jgi:hypothetical protein
VLVVPVHYVAAIVALRARFETALWYNDIALWCNARRNVRPGWREMTLTPVGGTPEEVGAFLKAETARWRNVIVSGGIKRQ